MKAELLPRPEDAHTYFRGQPFGRIFQEQKTHPNLWRIKNSGAQGFPELSAETLAVVQACNQLDIEISRSWTGSPMNADCYRTQAGFLDGLLYSATGNYWYQERGAWVQGPKAVLILAFQLGLKLEDSWLAERALEGATVESLREELPVDPDKVPEDNDRFKYMANIIRYELLDDGTKAYYYKTGGNWKRLREISITQVLQDFNPASLSTRQQDRMLYDLPKMDLGEDLLRLIVSWREIAPKNREDVTVGWPVKPADEIGGKALMFLGWAVRGRVMELVDQLKASRNPGAKGTITELVRIANWPTAPETSVMGLGRIKPSHLYAWIGRELRGEEG